MSQPVRNHIDNAQKALIGGDTAGALNELNSADVELLKITQKLPSGAEESPAEED
jgi:hypothetical protein